MVGMQLCWLVHCLSSSLDVESLLGCLHRYLCIYKICNNCIHSSQFLSGWLDRLFGCFHILLRCLGCSSVCLDCLWCPDGMSRYVDRMYVLSRPSVWVFQYFVKLSWLVGWLTRHHVYLSVESLSSRLNLGLDVHTYLFQLSRLSVCSSRNSGWLTRHRACVSKGFFYLFRLYKWLSIQFIWLFTRDLLCGCLSKQFIHLSSTCGLLQNA